MSFGTEQLGSPGPVQSIVLTKTGTSYLTINPVDFLDDFLTTAEQDNCTALPPAASNPIPPGGSCAIQVTDQPPAIGRMAVGKIVLGDSDPASPHVIALAGPSNPILCEQRAHLFRFVPGQLSAKVRQMTLDIDT